MPRPANPRPYHKTITRWLDASGKQVKPRAEGAQKVRQKTSTYYADIRGAGTVCLGTSDLAVANKRLNDKLKEIHQEELGIRDEFSRHAKVSIREHLQSWLEVLQAKGTGEKQRRLVESRLATLFGIAEWKKLADITADGALIALAELERLPASKGQKGRGAQTRAHYVTHLKAFCNWCVESDRLRRSPVKAIDKPAVEGDKRHMRREPSREEIACLIEHLGRDGCKVRCGLTGKHRALGYKVAMATGYRAAELRSLTRESFDLEAAVVNLRAKEEKARRGDVHPLPAWLVAELKEWFAQGGGAWGCLPTIAGRLLHADLDAARAEWIARASSPEERRMREASTFLCYRVEGSDGPLFWDMHSLRVWYISELAADPQMDIKTLMRLARHTKPEMSLAVYARSREPNIRAATDRLPNPSGEKAASEPK